MEVTREAIASAPPPRGVAVGFGGGVEVRWDVSAQTVSFPGIEVRQEAAQDPVTPGLVGVHPSGRRALVMACRSAHGDPQLVEIDRTSGAVSVKAAFDGPGWIVGGYFANGLLVAEQRLGDTPRHRLHYNGRTVFERVGFQPPCVPAAFDRDIFVTVATLAPDPLTHSGPTEVCLVHLPSGAVRALAPVRGTRITVDGDVVIVDGRDERVTITLRRRGSRRSSRSKPAS